MKRFFNVKKQYKVDNKQLPAGIMEYIGNTLKEIGVEKKIVLKMELLAEETITDFIGHSTEDTIYIKIKRMLGDVKIYISMKGEEFSPILDEDDITIDLESDEYNEANIKSILYKSYGENFKYNHKNNTNNVMITTPAKQNSSLYQTLFALALGLAFGFLMKLVIPHHISDGIKDYALSPFKTVFMNSLKI
ncbi:MAG: hypothetical protein K6D02_06820, partial [Lachnospiraceae bacterium]|nr:hypothetical protein [Lachnospiraceae bacterium]